MAEGSVAGPVVRPYPFGANDRLEIHPRYVWLQVALAALLDRLPGLHLAVPEDHVRWKIGMAVRGPLALPVGW
jgi:hypothetical protein